jgi:hypothetical protein
MVVKFIDYNGVPTNTYFHVNKELAYQFYHGDTKAYFLYVAAWDSTGHWIQFQSTAHQIASDEF